MESKLYILKNDLDEIVFIGTKSRIYDFLTSGNNSIVSSYYMYDFNNVYIKPFITNIK